MLSVFPRKISNTVIYIYLGTLALVGLAFRHHFMPLKFLLFGVMWVVGFFLLSSYLTQKWKDLPRKVFVRNLLLTAFGLRAAWVFFSYFFYIHETGLPFEYWSADAMGYFDDGYWLSQEPLSVAIDYLFTQRSTVSDSGYILYLSFLCRLTGSSLIAARLVKSIWSTLTVLCVYNLAKRNIGEQGARLAAIFTCLFPNLICYCGLHLKETEMIFLLMLFLERSDYLLRSPKFNVLNLLPPVLTGIALFTFRTALGVAALLSVAAALLLTTTRVVGWWRRILIIVFSIGAIAFMSGGTINEEVNDMWEYRTQNMENRRTQQAARGNVFTQYATGTVMFPLSIVLPFPTMVQVEAQEQQMLIHGGNYVRNVLGIFVLLGIFSAVFVTKNWRDLSLIGGFTFAYLFVISFSAFAGSERFSLPALPCLLIIAANGLTNLNPKNYRWVRIWYWVLPLMSIGWAYFKLGNRGLL